MPPNVHYILEKHEMGRAREKGESVVPRCAQARKTGRGNPEAEEATGGGSEKCVKKSEIITAPSRNYGGGGDCSGRNRRKDLNGLCRKVWD